MQAQDNSYKHAKLAPRHIRVLELQPSASANASLSCRLRAQTITDEPYEALSYVWGKPTVYHSTIWCVDEDNADAGGGMLHIGANLATALLAYRHVDQPRRVWVDAICIRQDDLDERLSQVRMMGDIFRNATQVLCWLGAFQEPATNEDLAQTAIHFLREMNKDQTGHLRQIQSYLLKKKTETNKEQSIQDSDEEQKLAKTWRAIKAFFDCEYFHRAWIIQEIGLARRAWISWGHSDICIDWAEVAHFVAFLDENGASVINELDLKSWVCNHINLVWSNHPDGTPLFDFSEVLHWARIHHSTDARDFVYSLLGHPSAVVGGQLLIEPLYTLPTAQVYTNLVVNTIRRTRSLHILAFVDHGEEPNPMGLPTWVPDWHALNLVAPLKCPTRAASEETSNVTVDDARKTPALRFQGALISSLRAYSDMIDPKELVITDYAAEVKKKLPFLLDRIYAQLVLTQPAETRPSADDFITALSFILTGAYRAAAPATSGPTQDAQRADCAAQAVAAEAMRAAASPKAEPGAFFGALSAEDASRMQALASSGCATQLVQDMTWTSMCRRVFITGDGQLGLGPRIVAVGDVVAVLPGSKYPLILRQTGTSSAATEYELVGPALLYGFMNGEVAEAPTGTFVEQGFCLV